MTLLRPFSSAFLSQATPSPTNSEAPSSSLLNMATTSNESILGLRKQILENCYFFSSQAAYINVILTRERLGTYKAIVLRSDSGHKRDALLCSESAETVQKAFELLLVKTADAVQNYITANGFHALPESTKNVVDINEHDHEDDCLSSISSSIIDDGDDLGDNGLADSTLELSEIDESAYESVSEQEGDAPSDTRATARSYNMRVRRASSHPRSPRKVTTDDDYSHTCYPTHNLSVHGRRAASPLRMPNPNTATPMHPVISGDPSSVMSPPSGPTTMPPTWWRPGTGVVAPGLAPGLTVQRNENGVVTWRALPPPGTVLPLRSHPSQFLSPQGSGVSPMGRQTIGVVQHQHQGKPAPVNNNSSSSSNNNNNNNNNTHQKCPQMTTSSTPPPIINDSKSNRINHSQPTPAPASSISSTPTLTISPNPVPLPAQPTKLSMIDYRLVIKTLYHPSNTHNVTETSGNQQYVEHRIIARTPPKRMDMCAVALRYIIQNPEPFRHSGLIIGDNKNTNNHNHIGGATIPPNARIRAMVTRAVFSVTRHGWRGEESYDLASYVGDDFSQLCMGMIAMCEEGEKSGGVGLVAMPLFEVVVSNIGS